MDQVLLIVNTVAVIVAAVALVLHMLFSMGTYKAVKQLQGQFEELMPRIQTFMTAADQTLAETRQQVAGMSAKVAEITGQAQEVLGMARAQLVRIDNVLSDAAERAKAQMDRVELVLDDTISRVRQTMTALHGGVMRPIREIQGLTAGLHAMFSTLFRGGRPTVAEATHDEEMFI